MKRRFNTTGSCSPTRHYMVRLDNRLKMMKDRFVDYGSYFVINRGRQYGKTTTLHALEDYLKDDYLVLSLDFQQMGTEDFSNEAAFSKALVEIIIREFKIRKLDGGEALEVLESFDKEKAGMKDLFICLSDMCGRSQRPIVLMIDEVDSASNNQVFIDFLAQLRSYYLNRDRMPIFHSVILAGVYDIKNLKLKLRPESEHQYNSPWNIAADFDIDMNLSAQQIAQMLEEYEADNRTGMDIKDVSEEIYRYTSGYPVLVSSICKLLDEKLVGSDGFETMQKTWTKDGVSVAVKQILKKGTLLFESMVKQLDIYTK